MLSQHILDLLDAEDAALDTTVEPKRGDDIFAGTDYPREWSGFVGQAKAIEQLRVATGSARARGVRLEHTLLASGIHGVGKTTLATLTAYQAEVGFVQTTGPLDVNEARSLMAGMSDRDVLFIDEAHLLVTGNRNRADWLLPFMTEGKLYTKRGAEPMPDITIIAATTDAGRLPDTLLSRFMVTPSITAYSPTEGARIALSLAERMGVPVTEPDDAMAIAQAADLNPRSMRRILTAVRDLQFAYPETHPNLDKAFEWAGFSRDGLTNQARDILLVLLASRDYTASSESLRAQLNEPGPVQHAEQQLQQRGLVTITGRGRALTDAGAARARREVEVRRG